MAHLPIPLLVLLCVPMLALGSDAEDAARRLSARLPRGVQAPVWRNLSGMPADETERVRRVIDEGLEAQAGVGVELRLTISENAKSYLLIAQGPEGRVWIETWPKPAAKAEKPPFQLTLVPIWEQSTPILDVAVRDEQIYVLEPMRIAGKDLRSVGLVLPRPMPRDPRGRIDVGAGESVKVLLPGVKCTGPLAKLGCVIAREPWIVAARNYFEGSRGRYYTSAEAQGYIFQAETDGRTRIYSESGDAIRVIEGWGSEIVTLESTCGTHVLAGLETDQLQAFRYAAGNLRPTTMALTLEGPVTAIWPSDRKDQATVIVQNRTTGNYEASRVSINCTTVQ